MNKTDTLVVGIPFDIEVRRGKTRNIVQMLTRIDLALLRKIAPHLLEERKGLDPRFDWETMGVRYRDEIVFNGDVLETKSCIDYNHPDADDIFMDWLENGTSPDGENVPVRVLRDHIATRREAYQLLAKLRALLGRGRISSISLSLELRAMLETGIPPSLDTRGWEQEVRTLIANAEKEEIAAGATYEQKMAAIKARRRIS